MAKPRLVSSRCLEFEHCRYDGQVISAPLIKRLEPFVEFVTICPEVGIGLGIPRKRIRVVERGDDLHLVQPETGFEFTEKMTKLVSDFLDSLGEVDGFVLKSASPSCGIRDVKIYPRPEKAPAIRRGSGFFGGQVLQRYGGLAVEDEARLRNPFIREHFLTKLFTLAGFRAARDSGTAGSLVEFHTRNKMLLMAYNQKELREMGRIVASAGRGGGARSFSQYREHLLLALARGPRTSASMNAMLHSLGHFKEGLDHQEKALLLDLIERYRSGMVCRAGPAGLLRSWAIRFQDEYILNQTFFEPFPAPLADVEVQRDYWK